MKQILTLLLLTAALPAHLLALGFRVAEQDPHATARANAFVATADRPSAVYYNPGGIGFIDGQRFHLGTYNVYFESEYTSPDGDRTVTNKAELQTVPQLFYTTRLADSPMSLGLGIYAPFGFALKYDDDVPFRNLALEGSIKFITINPVAAFRLTETLSIAVGPMINIAQAQLKQGILGRGSSFEFEGAGVGYGFNVGVLWKPHPMHSFGATYRSATRITFSGHSRITISDSDMRMIEQGNEQIRAANEAIRTIRETVGPFGDDAVSAALASFGLPEEEIPLLQTSFPEEDAHARFDFPQTVVVGYAFTPCPQWNFEINVDWTDWDNLNTVTLHQQHSEDAEIPFNYQSSFLWEFGATRSFENGVSVSAGYMFSERSVPNESFNPSVPDQDRHVFNLGLGYESERFLWDIAYQYTYGPSREIRNDTTADGSYEFRSHALAMSMGFKF